MAPSRVLVVEDERLIAIDLRHRLHKLGYQVSGEASTAVDALEIMRQAPTDLVMMDIELGEGMDGISAVEQMRLHFQVPVIYVTTHADDAVLARAKQTDPAGFLIKPCTDRELLVTIELALHRDRAEREKKRLLDEVERKQTELRRLNEELEQRVAHTVAELRARDDILIAQNRHAAVGQMVANIAHQWRQPLNTLSLVLTNIREAHACGDLQPPDLLRWLTRADGLVQSMSSTISDFLNFFRPLKTRQAFSVRRQVERAIALVEPSFRAHDIRLLVQGTEFSFVGPEGEFSQVVVNLLENAREACMGAAAGRSVEVGLEVVEGCGLVTVRDNGPGVPLPLRERIFEPYFSTREAGTGLGLYMSKMIVERSFGGLIEAGDVMIGAEFRVTCPLAPA